MISLLRPIKILDQLSYLSLLIGVILAPQMMDKNLINIFNLPKQYFLIGIILLGMILIAAKMVLAKKVFYRRSVLDKVVVLLLVLSLFTTLFSLNNSNSLLGRTEYFVLNFSFLFFLIAEFFVVTQSVTSSFRWRILSDVLIVSGGFTALPFLLKAIFKLDIFKNWWGVDVWNSVEQANSVFGLWLVVILLLAAGQIIKKNFSFSRTIIYSVVAVLCFTSLIFLSFNFLWWLLLLGLVILLFLGVSFLKEARLKVLSTLFAGLVLTIIFLIFQTPVAWRVAVPSEVSLGFKPSVAITLDNIFSGVRTFLLGSGWGTFSYTFSEFRPISFNNDSTAWSLRFSQPYNTWLALLSEGGVIFTFLFALLSLLYIGYLFFFWLRTRQQLESNNLAASVWRWSKDDFRLEVFVVGVVWLVLTLGMGLVFFSPILWWLWWMLLAMGIVGMAIFDGAWLKTKEWRVDETPQYSLAFSFVMILIIAGSLVTGVWVVKLYLAEKDFTAAWRTTDLITAQTKIKSALEKRSGYDIYHSAAAQAYLLEAANLSKQPKPDVQKISEFLAKAVSEARLATEISPLSVAIWENLATMYENASVLVAEARDWAIKALSQAKELEPTNPVLWWRLGNNYYAINNWNEAIKNYQKAIDLKNDYLGAYIGLANSLEQNNQLDKAIAVYQKILSGGANSAEFLFNYGRLLYNRNQTNDRATALQLWLKAVELQPNYSNALYSLGLYYEARGDKSTALQYYYKVRELNPDNSDVATKIKSLTGAAAKSTSTKKK